jgi:hypothetical protein
VAFTLWSPHPHLTTPLFLAPVCHSVCCTGLHWAWGPLASSSRSTWGVIPAWAPPGKASNAEGQVPECTLVSRGRAKQGTP